jgi:dTDP-4-amino-4,6-dideoxygalactose transaminase
VYDEQFKGSPVDVPIAKNSVRHVYNHYAIKIKGRDRLKDYLASKRIETSVYYPLPLHLQPALSKYGFNRGDFPVAEKLAKRTLCLPIFPELKEKEIKLIASEVLGFVSKRPKAA